MALIPFADSLPLGFGDSTPLGERDTDKGRWAGLPGRSKSAIAMKH
jgi:hypothetical protein